jgi:hypothetical protein
VCKLIIEIDFGFSFLVLIFGDNRMGSVGLSFLGHWNITSD